MKRIMLFSMLMLVLFSISAVSAFDNETLSLSEDIPSVVDVGPSVEVSSPESPVDDDEYSQEITAKTVKVPYSKSKIYFSVEVKNDGVPAGEEDLELELDGDSEYYYATTNEKGIATFELMSPDVGEHFVDITSRDGYLFSYFEVTPLKLTVKAPAKTVSKFSEDYFKVTLKNGKKPVKNVKIKLKIYTGKKSKTYKVKTNSKGIAKFCTEDLSRGTHKVVISSGSDNYKFSKTSKIKVKKVNKKRHVIKTFKLTKYGKTYLKKSGRFTFDVMKWKSSMYQELDVMVYTKDNMVDKERYMTKIFFTVNGVVHTTKWLIGSIDATYHKFQTDKSTQVSKVQVMLFK